MKCSFGFALREDLTDDKRFIPRQANETDTGYDVFAAQKNREPIVLKPFEYFRIPLGFRCLVPEGWWYELKPRSSTFAKKHIHGLIGTIDEAYPEEVQFAGQFIPDLSTWGSNMTLTINFGDAIGQIIPLPRHEMESFVISNAEYDGMMEKKNSMRKSGFGSTTK